MYDVEIYKPTINITSDQLSQIKEWEVGETYTVTMQIKQKSKSEDELRGKKYISGNFEIVTIKPEKEVEKDISDMNDGEFIQASGKIKKQAYEQRKY